jgi:hypothetical protein
MVYLTNYLNETKDFRKSVTYKPEISAVEQMLASGKNIWRDYLAKWKFLETKPYVVIARANPKLIEQDERERKMRAEAEVANLKRNTTLLIARKLFAVTKRSMTRLQPN